MVTRRRVVDTGRRPGPNTTRELIADTARKQFAESGFGRTSMRQVAIEAEVDPALVTHYFGTKLKLFLAVVELPIDPAALIAHVVDGNPDNAGLRLATVILDVLDDEVRRRPMWGCCERRPPNRRRPDWCATSSLAICWCRSLKVWTAGIRSTGRVW